MKTKINRYLNGLLGGGHARRVDDRIDAAFTSRWPVHMTELRSEPSQLIGTQWVNGYTQIDQEPIKKGAVLGAAENGKRRAATSNRA